MEAEGVCAGYLKDLFLLSRIRVQPRNNKIFGTEPHAFFAA